MSYYRVYVRNERATNATDGVRLVHNRFPSIQYCKRDGRKIVDYNDTWHNAGIHNASLTSLLNLKRICKKAREVVEDYNKNPEEKYRLELHTYIPHSSLRAAVRAGIITGTRATNEHFKGKYVNMEDPNDVIEVDKWVRKKATYQARPEVDYNGIISELNRFIKATMESYN